MRFPLTASAPERARYDVINKIILKLASLFRPVPLISPAIFAFAYHLFSTLIKRRAAGQQYSQYSHSLSAHEYQLMLVFLLYQRLTSRSDGALSSPCDVKL